MQYGDTDGNEFREATFGADITTTELKSISPLFAM
jgi:hypothetical protein